MSNIDWGQMVQPPGLEDRRAQKLAGLADKRWRVEVGGFEFGGVIYPSDITMQQKLDAAISYAAKNPAGLPLDWEVVPGTFVQLDTIQLDALGVALGQHIQATFTLKKQLAAAIEVATDEAELDAIDIEAGWPTP